jgi:hypothetical protein
MLGPRLWSPLDPGIALTPAASNIRSDRESRLRDVNDFTKNEYLM